MLTGVALQNRLTPMVSQRARCFGIGEKHVDQLLHMSFFFGDQKILAFCKQPFAIVPRRGNEWNSASQGFEHADRRNSCQLSCVRAARDVHGSASLLNRRWACGSSEPIRQIEYRAGIAARWHPAGSGRHKPGLVSPSSPTGSMKELAQLLSPLAIAPVADPQTDRRPDFWMTADRTRTLSAASCQVQTRRAQADLSISVRSPIRQTPARRRIPPSPASLGR